MSFFVIQCTNCEERGRRTTSPYRRRGKERADAIGKEAANAMIERNASMITELAVELAQLFLEVRAKK